MIVPVKTKEKEKTFIKNGLFRFKFIRLIYLIRTYLIRQERIHGEKLRGLFLMMLLV